MFCLISCSTHYRDIKTSKCHHPQSLIPFSISRMKHSTTIRKLCVLLEGSDSFLVPVGYIVATLIRHAITLTMIVELLQSFQYRVAIHPESVTGPADLGTIEPR